MVSLRVQPKEFGGNVQGDMIMSGKHLFYIATMDKVALYAQIGE
jgi:hypothetical protein